MKAVAVRTIFLVLIITLLITTTLVVFWKWVASQKTTATELSCRMKYMNYCERWVTSGREPDDWDEVPPTSGCEEFDIVKPSEEECKELFGVS